MYKHQTYGEIYMAQGNEYYSYIAALLNISACLS